VHVDDVREPTRGWADRVAPGDGIADVPRILRALDDAGYDGLYDMEIFSDDGTFGSHYADSLWRLEPRAAALTLRDAFHEVWQARTAVDESPLTPQGPLSPVRPHLRRQTVKE
jgi:sugar phosphate isomerase/epimerase